MSDAFVWPQANVPPACPPASAGPPPPDGNAEVAEDSSLPLPDPLGLASLLAPELSRLFGHRIGLKPCGADPVPSQPPLAEVGRLPVPATALHGGGAYVIAFDRASLGTLLDRMFGAGREPAAMADSLASLPPQSGSWKSLARLVGQALVRALQGAGVVSDRPAAFVQPSRVAPPAEQPTDGLRPQDRLLFQLDLADSPGWLSLRAAPAARPPVDRPHPDRPLLVPPEAGDPASPGNRNWGRRARDFALDLEWPVSMEVGEIPMPIGAVAALRVGDILPLDRPETISVLVSGKPLAQVAAADLQGDRRAAVRPASRPSRHRAEDQA